MEPALEPLASGTLPERERELELELHMELARG